MDENKALELLKKIENKYCFIYKIGEEYYVIGFALCRKCTETEKQLYSEYVEACKKITSEDKDIDKTQLYDSEKNKIAVAYDKINTQILAENMNIIGSENYQKSLSHTDDEIDNVKDNIFSLIKKLDDSLIKDLSKQIDLFVLANKCYTHWEVFRNKKGEC